MTQVQVEFQSRRAMGLRQGLEERQACQSATGEGEVAVQKE